MENIPNMTKPTFEIKTDAKPILFNSAIAGLKFSLEFENDESFIISNFLL
jgi:hypothetical protein